MASSSIVSDIGNRLAQSRLNKDSLVKLLRQASNALSELNQSSSFQSSIEPLNDSLIRQNLHQHKDKDVRLLVAVCFSEIMRILAPDPPYSDETLKDIFRLIVSIFAELSDTSSPYFARRARILETVASLKCCVLMLDIGCEDLVLQMFKHFFAVVREEHQHNVFQAMLSIMTLILEEKVSEPVMNLILRNLLRQGKGNSPANSRLATSVIQNCSEKLEPYIRRFLTTSILDRDSTSSELKEYYHEIIFEIFQCAPQVLLAVIPNLTHELLTDQVDVRIKAVQLLQRLHAVPGHHFSQEYHQLFLELLKRFSDKSAEVRLSVLECAKSCYLANPSGTEAHELLNALEGRLLDFDDKVRIQAVNIVCDLAKSNLRCIPPDLILQATERLRDKKVSVRKKAMQKLLELYRTYCMKLSEGLLVQSNHFEQIPCRILTLCYDKDCKDFRPQNMELVLAEDLFPPSLSLMDRTRHWVLLFSLFTPPHAKAFNSILYLKRRLQMEMKVYLCLRKNEKAISEEVKEQISASFRKMSLSFSDASKAEENFHKLHQTKDKGIFKTLLQLLDESSSFMTAQKMRDDFLKRIGEKHPHFEFLRILSAKCSYNIFSSEHVHNILLALVSMDAAEDQDLDGSTLDLLLDIVKIFPQLLRGSEELLLKLFSERSLPDARLIQMLADAGSHLSMEFSDISSFLEKLCLQGTRKQSKHSISAIAAFTSNLKDISSPFPTLYEKLVNSLHSGQNIPTVLQSLACIQQYSPAIFQQRKEEIMDFVMQKILLSENGQEMQHWILFNEDSESCSAKLKIYGLKILVKCFFPLNENCTNHQVSRLWAILSRLLNGGGFSDGITNSSDNEKNNIRLAAAKAVLQLARRWDLHIPLYIFHLTIQKARDPSPSVRKPFLEKVHRLLKEHVVPIRYACAFPLASLDNVESVKADSMRYLTEFINGHTHKAQIEQTSSEQTSRVSMINWPVYVIVFLVNVLAHDPEFPSESCQDEDTYESISSPLAAILQALVRPSRDTIYDSDYDARNNVSYILGIFRAIKKAEDATDPQITPKLHILSDIGLLMIEELISSHKCTSQIPKHVMLPLSLYRAGLYRAGSDVETQTTAYKIANSLISRQFIGKIFHKLNSPQSKQARKCQDSTLSVTCKRTKSNKTFQLENDPTQGKQSHMDEHQHNTRGKIMKLPLPMDSTLSESYHGNSDVQGDETDNGKDKPPSSCGSVVTRPLNSQTSSKEMGSTHLERTGRKINADDFMEPCSSKPGFGSHHNFKRFGDASEWLIGKQIKLWSPIDKCYQEGTVSGFDSRNSTHTITYDNGETEVLDLETEDYEIVSNVSLLHKVEDSGLSKKRTKRSESIKKASKSLHKKTDISKGQRECFITLDDDTPPSR